MNILLLLTLVSVTKQPAGPVFTSLREEAAVLSSRIGSSILVDSSLQNENLVLETRTAEPLTVLNAIAKAVQASVISTPSGYALSRTPTDLKAAMERRSALRSGWLSSEIKRLEEFRSSRGGEAVSLQAMVKELKTEADEQRDFTLGKRLAQNDFFASRLLPSEVLLEELLKRIGIAKLSKLQSGETAIYENDPAIGCLPLPSVTDLLSKYSTRMSRFQTMRLTEQAKQYMQDLSMDATFQGVGQSIDPPSLLRLRVRAGFAEYQIELEGFDGQGRRALSAYMTAPPRPNDHVAQMVAQYAVLQPEPEWLPLGSPWDPDSDNRERLSILGKQRLPDRFTHPDRDDPLRRFVVPCLSRLAESENADCVVVQVSDLAYRSLGACITNGKVSLLAVREILKKSMAYERIDDGRVVVWRSTDPVGVSSNRADRKALGLFAREALDLEQVSMRQSCKFEKDAHTSVSSIPDSWEAWAKAAVSEAGQANFTPEFARFVGSISDSDWNRLLRGEVLSISELGEEDSLLELLLKNDYVPVSSKSAIPEQFTHPLELLRFGSLGHCQVRVSSESEPLFRMRNRKGASSAWLLMSSMGIRFQVPFSAGGDTPRALLTRQEFEARLNRQFQLRTAVRQNTVVHIVLPNNAELTGSYIGGPSAISEEISYTDLPEELRNRFWNEGYDAGMRDASVFIDARKSGIKPQVPATQPTVIHP